MATEKRFTYLKNNSISQYSVLPIQEIGGKTYHCQGIVDKLNKLSDENEQLKQENERLSRLNEVKREQIKFHVDGYNQLKEVNKHSEETVKKQHELIKQLSQENCKIRAIIREAVNSERTDLGRSVLKNLALNIGVEL